MRVTNARYAQLVRFAWELRTAMVGSLLVVPERAEPLLFVPRRDGRKEAVLAVQRTDHWALLWRNEEFSIGAEMEPSAVFARRIAVEVSR